MKKIRLSLLLLFVFVGSLATQVGAETSFDGAYWQKCSLEAKRFYVQGALSGILLGQDRMVRQGLPGQGASPLTPECQRAVVALADRLERQVAEWDTDRLVAALDAFYADSGHLPLGVRWALMAVLLEWPGNAQQDGPQP